MLTVTGTLVRDAENRRTVDGQPRLRLLVDAGQGWPFEAWLRCTDGSVPVLRKGDPVVVTSDAIVRTVTDHDIPRFVLRSDGASFNVSF